MVQEILLAELAKRKRRNPSYSLRSFARDLGMSAGHLSSLIKGRKLLTVRQASAIATKLKLSPSSRNGLLNAVAPRLRESNFAPADLQRLRLDEFSLISDWYHLAILNLLRLPRASAQPRWIAARLGIPEAKAKAAMERLKRLGFVELKNGRPARTAKPLRTTNDVPSEAIRMYHVQNLDLAKEKIESVPTEMRTFSSMTMAINMEKLKAAKKMIEEFKEELCAELEAGEPSEVYTLSLQLFPVTSLER